MDWKRILQAAIVIIVASAVLLNCSTYGRLTTETIRKGQLEMNDRPVGERIAFWAEQFVGTPYDDDAAGAYVTRRKIVADDVADCMYLVYRSTELGSSNTPEEAIRIALTKRFHTQGVLDKGKVVNYEDRFQDGGEMIRSGRWGREITDELGKTKEVTVTGNECFDILPPDVFLDALPGLKNGDIIFFAKDPAKSIMGETVAHMGIVKAEQDPEGDSVGRVYLIHASGKKGKGGVVEKVPLGEYVKRMSFIGVRVTRFE